MGATISQRRTTHVRNPGVLAAVFIALASWPSAVSAQRAPAPAPAPEPFAARGWHLELGYHAAAETWNYNTSREELHGIYAGLTYGVRSGVQLIARAPLYYVDQRGTDGYLLGCSGGVRGRIYRKGRMSIFLELDLGISEADTIVPPRGTRFNYLAMGGAGATITLRPGLHLLTLMRWTHVSNGGREGRNRNPDIEAVGPQVGVLVGF